MNLGLGVRTKSLLTSWTGPINRIGLSPATNESSGNTETRLDSDPNFKPWKSCS